MDYESLHEDLRGVLDELIDRNRNAPIIVEGDRDRRSLRALEVRGEILSLNRGIAIFALCESLARRHREAIIMTDWDERGGRLARQLRDGLSANGVRYDDQLRARLTHLCKKDIKDVESLHAFVRSIEAKAHSRDQAKPSKRWYAERRA